VIVRVFSATLKPGVRAAYERLARQHGMTVMRRVPGFVLVHVAEWRPERPDEFTVVSVWRDLAALCGYTGDEWQQVAILPGEAAMIERMRLRHFDDAGRPLTELWSEGGDEARLREARAVRSARLSDAQWERVRLLLPPPAREGRPRSDDRRTLDGILYVLRTGCRWQDLPAEFGSGVTCWRRFTLWEAAGVWEPVLRIVLTTLDAPGRLIWAEALLQGPPVRRRRARSAVPRDAYLAAAAR
jgi:transposase/heme-degrading monooxygenase HmoA